MMIWNTQLQPLQLAAGIEDILGALSCTVYKIDTDEGKRTEISRNLKNRIKDI